MIVDVNYDPRDDMLIIGKVC